MTLPNVLVTASFTLFHRLVSLFYFKVPRALLVFIPLPSVAFLCSLPFFGSIHLPLLRKPVLQTCLEYGVRLLVAPSGGIFPCAFCQICWPCANLTSLRHPEWQETSMFTQIKPNHFFTLPVQCFHPSFCPSFHL